MPGGDPKQVQHHINCQSIAYANINKILCAELLGTDAYLDPIGIGGCS